MTIRSIALGRDAAYLYYITVSDNLNTCTVKHMDKRGQMRRALVFARVICPRVTAAATINVPVTIRSGMTSIRARSKRSHPSIVMVSVPAPIISAPIAFRNAANPEFLAHLPHYMIVVDPSARTAAIIIFSVAPTLGKSKMISAPCSFCAWQTIRLPVFFNLCAKRLKPLDARSIFRSPIAHPPG